MRELFRYAGDNLRSKTSYKLALGVAFFLLLEAWAPFSQIPVRVNGQVIFSERRQTVADILARVGMRTRAGDLLDLDGSVIEARNGWASRISLNGRPVPASATVAIGDRIEVVPALDRLERVTTEVQDVVLADRVEGEGRYVVVRDLGVTGKKLVARGRRSGKIVSARNLVEARPFHLARTDERPAKVVALTFDDGPTPPYTQAVVRVLKDLYAGGTFFVLGSQAALFPGPIREIKAAGFQVANHSYSHSRLDFAKVEAIARELDSTSDTVVPLINEQMTWFRPPYGATTPFLEQAASERGYRTVRWTVDSTDWAGLGPQAIADKVLREVHPGAIILMHDGGGDRTNTVRALPLIIRGLYERGYSIVTLDELTQTGTGTP